MQPAAFSAFSATSAPSARSATSPRRAATLALAIALPLLFAACGKREAPPGAQPAAEAAPGAPATNVAWQPYTPVLQHVYLAYFGCPADPAGLEHWGRQLAASSAATEPAALASQYRDNPGVRAMLDAFANSAEARDTSGSAKEFIAGLYRNLFQREADPAGLDYWVQALDKGVISRSDAALAIMLGAQHKDPGTLAGKVAVATRFTGMLAGRPDGATLYRGEADNRLGRAMMAKVDGATDPAAFDTEMRATITQMEQAQ
ncbi:DUF4214 domain-containing protein [Massilia sp. MS-15]|uniref:DUF4214 domain-containing protein n=1 Tax=Massilia sp. MS-15 TaxID=2878200 RepID=UPI001CD1DBC8|nr:DUF4214 domain-containing protein [Massilia sp. MS-15]MCA1246474.1 DUF4214 domain-containing protein [Massilia sp. MS-15]